MLLWCEDVHPHPGPLCVAQADVTSLCMHWHTVFNWQADLVLLSHTRLTAVAQQVMRAQAGALGWQAFSGAPLESQGGGGHLGRAARGHGHPGAPRHPGEAGAPLKGRSRTRQTRWLKPYGTLPGGGMSWWGLGGGRSRCTPGRPTASPRSWP